MARTAPRVWRGTCQRERTIWEGVSQTQGILVDVSRGKIYPKDHAGWEDDAEREDLDPYVDPQYGILPA